MKQIKVEQTAQTGLSKHRLTQYTTYPARVKHYKTIESFAEVLEKIKKNLAN